MNEYKLAAKEELRVRVRLRYAKPIASIKSFEEIAKDCNVSVQTMRRFFGKIEATKELSNSTLSQISKYAGFSDWQDCLEKTATRAAISERDKIAIDDMGIFFRNGEKHNSDYLKNTLIVDILNEYATIIYNSRENIEYFYSLYSENTWACDYFFAWLPNYNLFGQNWFRKILWESKKRSKSEAAKIAITNFLLLGSFLSEGKTKFTATVDQLNCIYKLFPKDEYMPFHEMRYHTIQMFEAKKEGRLQEFNNILKNYLLELEISNLDQWEKHEVLIFLCNSLIWLDRPKIAYDLVLKNMSSPKSPETDTIPDTLHFFGVNNRFVENTLELVYLLNGKKKRQRIVFFTDAVSNPNEILYNDYTHLLSLFRSLLSEKNIAAKRGIFRDLKLLVEKTNYTLIYSVLKNNDKLFDAYYF